VQRIVFVCTANRARSPLAELMARNRLDALPGGDRITVGSAGTWTPGGQSIWPAAGEEASRRGLDPSGFVSRPLSDAVVADAAVVLTATRALRDEVVAARPRLLRRAFTWCELAWVLANVTPDWAGLPAAERPGRLPDVASAARGRFPALPGGDLDVADPAGRSADVMRSAADRTSAAVTTIVEALCR
jgi:protein-tyrosine phosphatase